MSVTVERFNDPGYSRPRYRLRHSERKSYLRDGFTQGSYKLKRDAEFHADELMHGYNYAFVKRDGRYEFRSERYSDEGIMFYRVAVLFCGVRIGTAPNAHAAYMLAADNRRARVEEGQNKTIAEPQA